MAHEKVASDDGRAAAQTTAAATHTTAAAAAAAAASSTAIKLAVCTAGIWTFWLLHGYAMEKLFLPSYGEKKEPFRFNVFLLAAQCWANFAVGALGLYIVEPIFARLTGSSFAQVPHDDKPTTPVPATTYMITAATYLGAMFSSQFALRFVNYPTQVLGKSCKMVPVMISTIITRRQFPPLKKFIAVMSVTIGISSFMLNKVGTSAHNHHHMVDAPSAWWEQWAGLALLGTSLFLDGVTSGMQDAASRAHRPHPYAAMMHTNLWAAAAMTVACFVFGEAAPALSFMATNDGVLLDVLSFCLSSAIGQCFIFYVISHFDNLVCVTITTTRKFFAILISVAWFGHDLSVAQWVSVGLVFFGLALEIVVKERAAHRHHHHHGDDAHTKRDGDKHADAGKAKGGRADDELMHRAAAHAAGTQE